MKTIESVVLNIDRVPDCDGEVFDPRGISFAEHVRITEGFNHRRTVGKAQLRIEGLTVIATMELEDNFESKGLYPAIGGIYTKTSRRPDGVSVESCMINAIALSYCKNSDSRIPPLP
jgi:hypothetical protein